MCTSRSFDSTLCTAQKYRESVCGRNLFCFRISIMNWIGYMMKSNLSPLPFDSSILEVEQKCEQWWTAKHRWKREKSMRIYSTLGFEDYFLFWKGKELLNEKWFFLRITSVSEEESFILLLTLNHWQTITGRVRRKLVDC